LSLILVTDRTEFTRDGPMKFQSRHS